MAARPVEHTVLLTVTDTLRRRGLDAFGDDPPLFGWWEGGAACLRTPPFPLSVTELPGPAAPALAAALDGRPLPGVNGPSASVEAFAAAWGAPARVRRREWLYRLGTLVPPPEPPPGRVVPAAGVSRDLLIAWMAAFQREVHEPAGAAARHVENRIDGMSVWERDGEPVCLAGVSRPMAGGVRIGPVFTPPGHRGHGYGAALTAAVCRAALDDGVGAVLLFADVDNPVSNRLYQRLGFEALDERLVLDFDEGDGAHG